MLRLSGISVDLGGRRILEDVDLALREGERTALLGPNGAGKTTLVRAAMGLLPPSSGWIRLHGFDPCSTAGRRAAMERTGVSIEQPGVPGGVLAGRYLEWWGSLHGVASPRERARELLSAWEIPHALPAERLSQGQRQILQILRALVHDPRILVLDEPSSVLDPDSRSRFHAGIRQWMERTGGALLLTTHHLDEALETADNVVLISGGRVRAEGSPDSLGADPRLSRLLRLDSGQDPSSVADALECAVPGVEARPTAPSRGCPALRIRSPRGEEDHPAILAALCAAGSRVRSIDRDETTWREFWNAAVSSPPRSGEPRPPSSAEPPPPPRIGMLRATWKTACFHLDLASRERRMLLPVVVLEAFLLGSLAFSPLSGMTRSLATSFLLLAGLIPLGISTSLAADTFAGERERRSLETLLCAPQTIWSLFLGKGVAALLPAALLSWIATTGAWAILQGRADAPFATYSVLTAAVIPSLGVLSTAFTLSISRRARSVRAAAQFAALALLPFLASSQFLPPLTEFLSPEHELLGWFTIASALFAAAALVLHRVVATASPARLLRN